VEPLWYVDADTLGLAHVLARARPDVTHPGDNGVRHKKSWRLPPCIISDPAMHDDEWIPAVSRAGMAIITRDKHIATRTAEKNEVIAASARMFAITTPGNLRT
jgi:PIN like domain